MDTHRIAAAAATNAEKHLSRPQIWSAVIAAVVLVAGSIFVGISVFNRSGPKVSVIRFVYSSQRDDMPQIWSVELNRDGSGVYVPRGACSGEFEAAQAPRCRWAGPGQRVFPANTFHFAKFESLVSSLELGGCVDSSLTPRTYMNKGDGHWGEIGCRESEPLSHELDRMSKMFTGSPIHYYCRDSTGETYITESGPC